MICKIIGTSYQTASLELREKLALTAREKDELVNTFLSDRRVREVMILSTCNRMEIYLLLDDESAENLVWEWLTQRTGEQVHLLQKFIYSYTDLDAVRHLFNVACGLDSLILGEEQILGQVREAYLQGIDAGSISTYFHHLGSEALRIGKQVRTETGISRSGASISSAAVRLMRGIYGDLRSTRALVLGTGEMGRLALHELHNAGVTNLLIINRSAERGRELASQFGGQSLEWEAKRAVLPDVDLVISSTSAPHYVLTYEDLKDIQRPEERPLVLVDIAVPRDVDPLVGTIPGVKVYNIDSLREIAYEILAESGLSMKQAEEMVEAEVQAFSVWQKSLKVHPVIREFRERAELIRLEELEKVRPQLEQLGDEGAELVQELTHRIVSKLLHEPTVQLKKLALEETESGLSLICRLYNLSLPGHDREEKLCQSTTQ